MEKPFFISFTKMQELSRMEPQNKAIHQSQQVTSAITVELNI